MPTCWIRTFTIVTQHVAFYNVAMSAAVRKILCLVVVVAFALQASGCGTIFFPERKGQTSSKFDPARIDPVVAVLDGVGLLFFLIPGVIAYAVDFSNGTIYLPHGHRNSMLDLHSPDGVDIVKLPDGKMDNKAIEAVLEQKLDCDIDMSKVEMVYVLAANTR